MVAITFFSGETPRKSKRTCVTRSMTTLLNSIEKRTETQDRPRLRYKRRRNSSSYCCKRKPKSKRRKHEKVKLSKDSQHIEISDLSEEVLMVILENVSAPGLVNLSKTCTLFHRLCHTDTLWKHRAKVSVKIFLAARYHFVKYGVLITTTE